MTGEVDDGSTPHRRHPPHEKVPQSTAIKAPAGGGELAGPKRACVNGCTSSFGACHEPSLARPAPVRPVLRSGCHRGSRVGPAARQSAGPGPAAGPGPTPSPAKPPPPPGRARQAAGPGRPAGAQGSRGRHGQRPADPAVGARGRPAVAAAAISQHAPAGGVPRAARPHHRQQAGGPGGQEEQGHRGSGLQEAHGLRRGPGAAGFLDPARDRPPGHGRQAAEALRGAAEADADRGGGARPAYPGLDRGRGQGFDRRDQEGRAPSTSSPRRSRPTRRPAPRAAISAGSRSRTW